MYPILLLLLLCRPAHTHNLSIGSPPPSISAWSLHNCLLRNGKISTLFEDGRNKKATFGVEEIQRDAITVIRPLLSLRTPLPLDLRKLQLDSSKAIKLSTDKNKRMSSPPPPLPQSLLFPLSFLSPYPLHVPLYALSLTHLWGREHSLISRFSLSLPHIIRSWPTPCPPFPSTNVSPCLVVCHL